MFFGLFLKYNSCGFCPGYKETLVHMTYILELAEAHGRDSVALVAEAWHALVQRFCMDFVEILMDFLLKFWWILHRYYSIEILMDCAYVLLRFWWVLHMFCWDSDGFCMGSFSNLMGYVWNCLGNSDGFYLYYHRLLLDSALPCVFMEGGMAFWRHEAQALVLWGQGSHEEQEGVSHVRLWSQALMFCFADLVKESRFSLVSEWFSHMVLWCFLISKCILLGFDCVVVGFHGVLWVECLWDGFLLPGIWLQHWAMLLGFSASEPLVCSALLVW